MVYIAYFGSARPLATTLARRLEYFNEIFLQLASYHLILYPLSVSLEDEKIMGWSMIGFIVSVFTVNLGVILVINFIALKRKLYLQRLKKRQAAQMAEMQELARLRKLVMGDFRMSIANV